MITDELLGRLSPDFLNVTRRSQDAASEVQRKADWWAKVLPFGAALLTAIVTAFAATAGIRFENAQKARALNERIARLEGRIGELGGDVNLDALETRVSTLEAKQQEAPAR